MSSMSSHLRRPGVPGAATPNSGGGNAAVGVPRRAATAEEPARARPRAKTGPINCLVVDDSKFDRQRLRRIADQTNLALSITEAATLDEALNAIRVSDFAIILLDQGLPDGDGTTAAELLKKHMGEKAPPIIMVSGSQESAMPARAFAAGCTEYLSKDHLSIPGLEKAIASTIAKVYGQAPGLDAPSPEEALLRGFAEDLALELRIPLSRMLRLIARTADLHRAAAPELDGLKSVCHEMWHYLDHLAETAGRNQG